MARVTTEDCVTEIPNRFELIMTAAQRARKIGAGAPITLPRDNDKNTVVALREIAEKSIDKEEVQEDLVQSYQRVHESENDDIDLAELIGNEMDNDINAGDTYGEETDDADNLDDGIALSDDEMIASLAAGE